MTSALRRTANACRTAAAAAAAVVLLVACGGGEEPAAESSASSAAESSAGSTEAEASETTGGSGGSEFCTQAAGIEERVDSALTDAEGDDPSVPDAFRQISEELRTMEPPAEIASDWAAMAGGLDRMADAFADFDVTDADSLAALETAEGELSTASENVENYLRDECGIEP